MLNNQFEDLWGDFTWCIVVGSPLQILFEQKKFLEERTNGLVTLDNIIVTLRSKKIVKIDIFFKAVDFDFYYPFITITYDMADYYPCNIVFNKEKRHVENYTEFMVALKDIIKNERTSKIVSNIISTLKVLKENKNG